MRWLAVAGGLAGAATLSQYPEFSQQYIQRLGGQVDALGAVVADFDTSAAASGLTRQAALSELRGTAFLAARQADMAGTFDRHRALSDNLTFLRLASPIERIAMPHRMADPDTFAATWADFRPALPLTAAGGVAAGLGFAGGWGAIVGLIALILWPFRPAKAARKPMQRTEPRLRANDGPKPGA